jgi:hypothetical protein
VAVKLDVSNYCQNIGQAGITVSNIGGLSESIAQWNFRWGGRGSTTTEDELDAAIATRALAEIEADPAKVVRGEELAERLKKML